MNKYLLLLLNFIVTSAFSFTVLDAEHYKKTVAASRTKVDTILKTLKSHRHENTDTQIAWITHQLLNIPYLYTNAMGEGDWQPRSWEYQSGAVHIDQNPVYRLDGLNCQTFVQVAMALFHSNTLAEFDKTILKIAYGAAGNPNNEIVRFYDRNHFIEADFNPVNQRNGWLSEASSLTSYTKTTSAVITRQKWFSMQKDHAVKVLSASSGSAMEKRYNTVYQHLTFPHFNAEKISLSYLPKEMLALPQENGDYKPNKSVLDKIPTPALAEIVRDINQWKRGNVKVKDLIGSALMVSHLGLLYRQTFKYHELIYQKIHCDNHSETSCQTQPVYCQKNKCEELMFSHVTNGFPTSFYNRVVSLPLYNYLTDEQFGPYSNMELRSILGVHIEILN